MPTAGMGGNVLLVERLIAMGVPRGNAAAALLVQIVGYYASYALVALAVLTLLWLHSRASIVVAGTVSLFLVVAVAIPALAYWIHGRGIQSVPVGSSDEQPSGRCSSCSERPRGGSCEIRGWSPEWRC